MCVGGEGPDDAEVIVIGEAPGREEDRTGRPFVGQSGQLIREELRKTGFKSVYITNVVKCRPPDNRDPKPEEIKACRQYLDEEIRTVGSKYVLTLGRFSSKSVLKKSKITLDHGQIVTMSGFTGLPAYHPAYCLRDPSKLPALQSDLKRLRNEIDGVKHKEPKWAVVTFKNIGQFVDAFANAGEFSYDVETTSLFPYDGKGKVRCLSIGLEDCSWVIPLEMPGTSWELALQIQFLKALEAMVKEDKKCAIAQNGKFDQHWLKIYYGINFGLDFDTIIASHILDENTDHDLKYLARTELDAPEYDLPLKEKLGSELHTEEGRERYLRYAAFDAAYTLRLKRIYARRLQAEPGLKRLFYRLMMHAARAIEKIECRGITLDMPKYATTEIQVRKDRDTALAALDQVARKYNDGNAINWNSPAQISKLFYERLKLKCSVKTKTGNPSTGEDALVELKGQHEVADQLIRYRELEKFLGTYIEGFKEFIYDGRLYLGYKIIGTVTGRFSSRLHQIPRDGTIRNLGIAPPGWEFAQADLSQAELRIAAELSRDLELVTAFRTERDVHWKTLMFMIGSGRASGAGKLASKTAAMYCMQKGVSADRTSCEILQGVWDSCKGRSSTEKILQEVRTLSEDARKTRKVTSLQDLSEIIQASRNCSTLLRSVSEKIARTGDETSLSQENENIRRSNRGRVRRQSERREEPILERRGLSNQIKTLEEEVLRALWKYEKLRCSPQERESSRQPEIELRDALSLLSSQTPQEAILLDKTWKEWRKKSKSIGFGYVFGMYENKFIQQAKTKYDWDCTYEEAHDFRTAYFELYQGILPWHEKQKRLVKIDGYVKNLFGRVRRLPGVYSSDRELRGEAERQAINSPVQGTIGDWKSAALVEIEETIPTSKLRIVGEHHDALLMIFRPQYRDEVLPRVRAIMCRPKLFDEFKISTVVPMQSEIEIGSWGAGISYEDPKNA